MGVRTERSAEIYRQRYGSNTWALGQQDTEAPTFVPLVREMEPEHEARIQGDMGPMLRGSTTGMGHRQHSKDCDCRR